MEHLAGLSPETLDFIREEVRRGLERGEGLAEMELQLKLLRGTFFTPLDEVWRPEPVTYDSEALASLRRIRVPELHSCYSLTSDCAAGAATGAVADGAGASACFEEEELRMWSTDIFGASPFEVDVSHLLPASPDRASVYFNVVQCVLSMNPLPRRLRARMKTLQKAIHGTLGAENYRIELTGVKHFPTNKIRLAFQWLYFDKMSCVVIVPIMSVEEMRRWDGRGYRAIVLAGGQKGPTTAEDVTAADAYRAIKAGYLAPGTMLGDVLASTDEIEMARSLLVAVVRGLAYSLHHRERRFEANLSRESRKILFDLRQTFASKSPNSVCVPRNHVSPYGSVHVRVVTFADPGSKGHLAPDPLLLAVTSAVHWSRRNQQTLLPVGEPPAKEDKMDVLADEQYLDYVASLHRPKTRTGLARRLRRPNG
jgi:hypothetical protein